MNEKEFMKKLGKKLSNTNQEKLKEILMESMDADTFHLNPYDIDLLHKEDLTDNPFE